eukprot:TRINITY_DN35620_c0_g1_i1.p1 TRINITY_DN35620_c0_g1~~TRINITY_DN35620_c0_g1_i1.p1  ORF type:complete len:499 (-),score=90.84 TRINITY_DN35620_c0_g1_i1:46-1395(-)
MADTESRTDKRISVTNLHARWGQSSGSSSSDAAEAEGSMEERVRVRSLHTPAGQSTGSVSSDAVDLESSAENHIRIMDLHTLGGGQSSQSMSSETADSESSTEKRAGGEELQAHGCHGSENGSSEAADGERSEDKHGGIGEVRARGGQGNGSGSSEAADSESLAEKRAGVQEVLARHGQGSGSGSSQADDRESLAERRSRLRELHAQGQCNSCSYHLVNGIGCRRGDACRYCHECDRRMFKAWRRRMKSQKKLEDAARWHDVAGRVSLPGACPRSQGSVSSSDFHRDLQTGGEARSASQWHVPGHAGDEWSTPGAEDSQGAAWQQATRARRCGRRRSQALGNQARSQVEDSGTGSARASRLKEQEPTQPQRHEATGSQTATGWQAMAAADVDCMGSARVAGPPRRRGDAANRSAHMAAQRSDAFELQYSATPWHGRNVVAPRKAAMQHF